MKQTLLLVLTIMLLAGCDNGILSGGNDPQIEVLFTTDPDAARGMRALSRAVLPSTDSTYDSALYGDLITTITPTEFGMPFTKIHFAGAGGMNATFLEIGAALDAGTFDEADFYADFTRALPMDISWWEWLPHEGTYDYLSILFHPYAESSTLIQDGSPIPWDQECSIRFTLPEEYTDVVTTFESTSIGYDELKNYVSRESLQVFTNSMSILSTPIFNDGVVDMWSLQMTPLSYLYGSEWDTPDIYNLEGESILTGDYYTLPGYEYFNGTLTSTNAPVPVAPMNPIIIPEDYSVMRITFLYDIHNIIQVYAGPDNTPYTEDDKFILAPNFWERLSVFYTIY